MCPLCLCSDRIYTIPPCDTLCIYKLNPSGGERGQMETTVQTNSNFILIQYFKTICFLFSNFGWKPIAVSWRSTSGVNVRVASMPWFESCIPLDWQSSPPRDCPCNPFWILYETKNLYHTGWIMKSSNTHRVVPGVFCGGLGNRALVSSGGVERIWRTWRRARFDKKEG